MEKEARDYTGAQLQDIYKALAIISETPTDQAIGSFFLKLEGQPFPSTMFDSEKEARIWLKNYL